MGKSARVALYLTLAFLVVAALIIAAGPASAVQLGNHEVNFVTVRYDYPASGQSTWYYTVISGERPAISHVTFALNLDCLNVVDAGTWDGSNLDVLNSGDGSPFIGRDGNTDITGVKFDQGFNAGETRHYYFTVDGNYAADNITVATKAGRDVNTAQITGPNQDCAPHVTPPPPPTATPTPTNTPEPTPCATVGIDLEKHTNGVDADTAPGPSITVGSTVTWTYNVTNTGSDPLSNITVVDNKLGPICTISTLAPGASATCTTTGTATSGQYENIGKAIGYCGDLQAVDRDYSHYLGVE